jgi:hypothetical protein
MINSAPLLAQGYYSMDGSHIVVDRFAGDKGEETPRAFIHEGSRRIVTEIVTRWYTDTHCYFRVQADDGYRYVLRHDLDNLVWELVMGETTDGEA